MVGAGLVCRPAFETLEPLGNRARAPVGDAGIKPQVDVLGVHGVVPEHVLDLAKAAVKEPVAPTGARANTVYLSILIALSALIGGNGLMRRGRRGKLLIFRFTPRGWRRLRLETTRSSRISSSTFLWNAFLR
jgi:hypothetical protein